MGLQIFLRWGAKDIGSVHDHAPPKSISLEFCSTTRQIFMAPWEEAHLHAGEPVYPVLEWYPHAS